MSEERLSDRKRILLYNAIDNYIKVASTITSLLVKNSTLHDLSTATIRNELSALEEMGYLRQLHTSSGRVPTAKGYRFFVNETLKNSSYDKRSLKKVKQEMFSRTNNLSEIVDSISKAVMGATNYPTVFMFDGFQNLIIEDIRIVFLLQGQVLVLIDTNVGAISNTISSSASITKQDCDNASRVFSNIFSGKPIEFLTQNINSFSDSVKKSMAEYEEVFKLVLEVLGTYYDRTKSNVKGVTKLLTVENEQAREIMEVLGSDRKLKEVMDTQEDSSVTINIGEENNQSGLSHVAVVRAPIVYDGKKIATVGVIGPDRLDYASVAGVLKFVTDEIARQNIGGRDDKKGR